LKHRLFITVSTIHGTRHFTLHQLVMWGVLSFLLLLTLVFASGYAFIQLLQGQIVELHQERGALTTSSLQLQLQNSALTESIASKSEELSMLNSQLGLLEDALRIVPASELEAASLEERLDIANLTLHQKRMMLSMLPSGIPMKYRRVSSQFGRRIHPITHKRDSHKGVDLRADTGTPIYATADGVVKIARDNYDKGYGNMVVLDHSFGFTTRYAHMSKLMVKRGQYVKQGELLGHCGNSGDSTASHLHYEVRFLETAYDPKPFMAWDLYSYESLFETVRTIPWGSFQQSVNRINELPAPLLSRRAADSMATSN